MLSTGDNTDARVRQIEDDLTWGPFIPAVEGGSSSLLERLAYYHTPGLTVAVIDNGEIAWSRGYGVLDAETGQPVTPGTIFQACSISKHVAMVSTLHLVQDGVLDLDEDVNRYLTSWKLPANGHWEPRVTIRHLLGHTAGLTQNWYRGFRRGDPVPSLLQVLDGQPPANSPPIRAVLIPGSQFQYSGSHYSVLQQLMMDVTGRPFPELMHDLVFVPLGMAHSSYDQQYPETGLHPVAVGHYLDGEPVAGKWRVIPEMAGAGLWTTSEDLATLAIEIQRAHLDRPTVFLRKETVDEALTPQAGGGYGLGTRLEGEGRWRRFGHGGSNIGYRCLSTAYAELGQGAVIMTNSDDGISVALELVESIAREYGWPDYSPDRTPTAVHSRVDDPYIGEYELRPTFIVKVRRHDASLVLEVPDQSPILLRPSSETTFFAEVLDTEVTFRTDDRGTVAELVLRQENSEFVAVKRT